MLLSRSASALRAVAGLTKSKNQLQLKVRNHGSWYYRVSPAPPPRGYFIMADIVQGFAWWWVLWHLWTEPEHITGEFEYPDPHKWTDEELGIPDCLPEQEES